MFSSFCLKQPSLSLLPLVLCLALCACGRSQPTQYYAFASQPENLVRNSLPKTTLRIARVALPQYLEREPLVLRKKGHVDLQVDSLHVWAEPLTDGVRRLLASELRQPLLAQGITLLPTATEKIGTYTLLVDISRLDGSFGDMAEIEAHWSLLTGEQDRIIRDGFFAKALPVPQGSYQDLVETEGNLVRDLARHMLAAMPRHPQKSAD
ncbi:MAG: membrane integrity-associated transporter subunit PqiC [Desulfovibrio sp.]|nr:membrane integrity-associated transporter subunit PqiC [Desulfovibrio sp.]